MLAFQNTAERYTVGMFCRVTFLDCANYQKVGADEVQTITGLEYILQVSVLHLSVHSSAKFLPLPPTFVLKYLYSSLEKHPSFCF